MRHVGRFGWLAVAVVCATATGCGSGGSGGGAVGDPIVITSTALPPTLSGQVVNHQIPFSGGSGGPYILELLSGQLPDGVGFDNDTVSLVGRALEADTFTFRLKLTDTGSSPFSTTTATFTWDIGVGSLVIVTDADLPDLVFNQFTSIQLVIAGGSSPYACQEFDDPSNPNDEALPTGLAIPPQSCSIVGTPQEAKPGESPTPFFVTVQAFDHADKTDAQLAAEGLTRQFVTKTFEITVLVPPIIISTTSLPDGKCGTNYSEIIEIVDGVPPFRHSVVIATGETTRRNGEPGTPDGVDKGSPTSAYAAEDDDGPSYSARFPEGLVLNDSSGQIHGIPRRRGSFVDWTYHVQSVMLSSESSQNRWRSYTFSMADAEPPALALDPSVLAPGSSSFSPPNNKIPDLEVTKPYSLQFDGLNGVPMDGDLDAPHESQLTPDTTEEAGHYAFTADFGPGGIPDGMTFGAYGLFEGTPTERSGLRTIVLTAIDEQLPISGQNTVTGEVQYSVGPDIVVIAESLSSATTTTFDDVSYAYGDQTVEIFEPFSGTPQVRPLASTDMAAGHSNPTGATLAASLTGIDFIHASANPTWWANDVSNINALAPRAMQHGDAQRRFPSDAFASDVFRRVLGGGSTQVVQNSEHAPNSAMELPEIRSANPGHNPASGVYRDGGLLYGFDSATEFGIFVVRKDGKIYIPVAFNKSSSGFTGFGDGWVTPDSSTGRSRTSAIRVPQITVSPDGRFAAMKLKTAIGTFNETINNSRIVLFSLTGEKPFPGSQTSRVFTPNANSSAVSLNGGLYLYGDTLTLTNRFLYYLCGDFNGQTNGNPVIYSRHWVYRVDITGGPAVGTLLPGGTIPTTQWTNLTSTALAVPFHKWMTPGVDSISTTTSFCGICPMVGSYGTTGPNPHFFTYNYANFGHNSQAPHPFRVSANGNACVIVGAPDSFAGVTGSTNFQRYFLFVDYDSGSGTPVFREVGAGTGRRYGAPSRFGGFAVGEDLQSFYTSTPSSDRLYGWYDGPYPQIEVSDDGKRVAAVFNQATNTWSTGGINNEPNGREDVIVFSGTNASTTDPWSTITTKNVTQGVFNSPTYWRFGCLAFTRDHNGLVFWGGYSNYDGNTASYFYMHAGYMTGTLYASDVSSTSTNVTSILPTSDGGGSAGVTTYSTSSPVALNSFTNFSGEQGAIRPQGGFYSNNGKFVYLRSATSLNSTDFTLNRLVGVNVSAVSSSTINGRDAMRAFHPTTTTRYGFGNEGYYGGLYGGIMRWHRGLGGAQSLGFGYQVSAARSGLVFFGGYYQQYSYTDYPYTSEPTNSVYYYPGGAHPSNYGDCYPYAGVGGDLFGFDADMGGNVTKLTSLGGTTSPGRFLSYLQPDPTGQRLAFVYNHAATTTSPYDVRPDRDNVVVVSGIQSAGGAVSATGVSVLETNAGRASTSIALDYVGSKIFYAFGTGSNENTQVLTEKTLNGTGSSVLGTRTAPGNLGGSGGQARFAVLWAGR
jgi:hypothetical protein